MIKNVVGQGLWFTLDKFEAISEMDKCFTQINTSI